MEQPSSEAMVGGRKASRARYAAGAGPAAHTRDARPRYHPLAYVFGAVFAGAAIDKVCRPAGTVEVAVAVTLAALWLLCVMRRSQSRLRRTELAAVLSMVAATAATAHHVAWWQAASTSLHAQVDERLRAVVAELRIRETPSLRDTASSIRGPRGKRRWNWEANVVRLRHGQHWRRSAGIVELRMMLDRGVAPPPLNVGDLVRVFGEASRYPAPSNPGDWDPRQSRRTRRRCVLYAKPNAIRRVTAGQGRLRRVVHSVRESIHDCLATRVSRGQSRLAAALLLGRREQLTRSERDCFVNAGIAHLLALSGLHVGLLAGVAWGLGRAGQLSRSWSCGGAVLLAVSYLIVAGPRPSLLRATVLVAALAWARWQGRPQSIWNSLAAAALVLAAVDPTQLFDTGAQLSFLAVAALCCWGRRPRKPPDPLRRLIDETRPWWLRTAKAVAKTMRAVLFVNLMVWLMTAPVTAWRFGRLAPVGILLNPIVGPLVACALYATLAALAFAALAALRAPGADHASQWWGDVSGWLLQWITDIAQQGAAVPGGHFDVTPPPALWAAAASLLWLAWGRLRADPAGSRRPGRAARVVFASLVISWLAWGLSSQLPAKQHGLQVTVLSVGHGNCVVVRTPTNEVWVFDAGRLGGGAPVERVLRQFLERAHIRKIDRLILSHEDVDHYNAAPRLLEAGLVRRLAIGPRMLSPDRVTGEVKLLSDAIAGADAPVERLQAGDQWSAGSVHAEVLHPPRDWELGEADNADSIVVQLTYLSRSVLITGDVEGPGLTKLLARPLYASVLLAPHHGSPHSYPMEVAEHCRARWMLVSSGFVRTELRDSTRCRVLQTARDGAIQAHIDEQGLTVQSWRRSPWPRRR